MISRRSFLGGIGGLTAPVLTGCASHRSPAPARAMAQPAPAGGLDAVIDLSHNVAVTDFALARRQSNILGIIHKASEGVQGTLYRIDSTIFSKLISLNQNRQNLQFGQFRRIPARPP